MVWSWISLVDQLGAEFLDPATAEDRKNELRAQFRKLWNTLQELDRYSD